MSVNFYEQISRAELAWDYSKLESIQEDMFKEEWALTVQRLTASVKDRCEINICLSELQNNMVHCAMAKWRLRER